MYKFSLVGMVFFVCGSQAFADLMLQQVGTGFSQPLYVTAAPEIQTRIASMWCRREGSFEHWTRGPGPSLRRPSLIFPRFWGQGSF